MTEHTPTPWRFERLPKFGECDIYGPNNEEIALIYISNGADDPETYPAEANAALIVRAVNNHDRLVAALIDIAGKGTKTGFGRTALARIASEALRDLVGAGQQS